MKKHLLTLICLLCLALPALATDKAYSWSYSSNSKGTYTGDKSTNGTAKLGDVTWNWNSTGNALIQNYGSGDLKGVQIGGNASKVAYFPTDITFTTDYFKDYCIKSVEFKIGTGGGEVSVTVSVDGTTLATKKTSASNSTGELLSWSDINKNCYNNIAIKIVPPTGNKNVVLNNIKIVYSKIESVEPEPSKTPVTLGWDETPKDVYFTGESAEFTLTVDPAEAASAVTMESSNENAVKLTKLDGGKYKADFLAAADNVTIKASIASDNETYSATPATLSLNVAKNYTSVTDFYTIGEKNTGYINFPLTVTYQNGNYTYAVDDNGTATLIYKSGVPTYSVGDVIPAGWKGTYSPYNGLPEIVPVIGIQAATENKGYTVPEVQALSANTDLNKIVILKDVTFSSNTPSDNSNFTGKVGDTEYKFYNQFKIAATAADTYDVKVAVNYSNNALSLFPLEYIAKPVSDVPIFKVADVDWYEEATRTVYKGVQVTLSAPEGLTDWIMSYTVNDGEENLTDKDVTITISDDTTISATFDEENYITWKFTVVQLPELTFSPEIGAVLENSEVKVSSTVEGAKLYGYIGEDAVEGDSLPYTFTVTDDVEINLWAEHDRYKDSEFAEGKYTIKLPPLQGKWEKVGSLDQLKDNDIVTFMAKEYTGKPNGKNVTVTYPDVVMSGFGNDLIKAVEFNYIDNKLPTDVLEFDLTKTSDGKFNFYSTEYNGYLNSEKDKKVSFTKTAKDLTLSINEEGQAIVGGVTLTNNNKTTNYTLQYNPNVDSPVNITTARFTFYSSEQQPIYMYRQTHSGLDKPVHEGKETDASGNVLLTFSCQKGAHLWTLVEDLPDLGNDNSGTDMGAGAPKRTQDVVDGEKIWTNHETHNVTYKLPANRMLTVKAVSADGKKHSEALVFGVTNDGDLVTGIDDIVVDGGEGAVRYFNLQGVEVKNPANGIFIRVANGKTSKVAL